MAQGQTAPYILRAGDELEIRAFAIPELNQIVRVRPDGKISLILLHDVDAAGFTPEQLSETLCSNYARHFRNPRLTAIVRTFSNFSVYVGGEVARAGLIPLAGSQTVASAIIQAGGFRDESAPKKVMVLRKASDGESGILNLDLDDVLTGGKPDIVLQPSDVIYVPRTAIQVYAGGEVTEPGLIPLQGQMTALTAIIRAKGFKPTAKIGSVVLLHDSGRGKPVTSILNMKEIIAHRAPDVPLSAYDVVYVAKSRVARMDQFMDQYIKQLLPISINGGFTYLLGGGTVF